MEHYLIDTNVVSDYFSASISQAGMALMDLATDGIRMQSLPNKYKNLLEIVEYWILILM